MRSLAQSVALVCLVLTEAGMARAQERTEQPSGRPPAPGAAGPPTAPGAAGPPTAPGAASPPTAPGAASPQPEHGAPQTKEPDADASTADGARRTLGGHRFIPFRTVLWPFVTWRFGSSTAMGVANVRIPRPGPQGGAEDVQAELAVLEQSFTMGLALTSWLGAEVDMRAGLTSGRDQNGALVVGANYAYGGGLGAVFNLVETRRFYLTGRADARVQRAEGLIPQRLIDSIAVEDGLVGFDLEALTFDAMLVRTAPSLSAAIALSRHFGVQMSASYDARMFRSTQVVDWTHSVSAAMGASLRIGPVAALFGGRIDRQLGGERSLDPVLAAVEPIFGSRGELEGGLYYAGRENLDLGVAVTGLLDEHHDRVLGSVQLTYYW